MATINRHLLLFIIQLPPIFAGYFLIDFFHPFGEWIQETYGLFFVLNFVVALLSVIVGVVYKKNFTIKVLMGVTFDLLQY